MPWTKIEVFEFEHVSDIGWDDSTTLELMKRRTTKKGKNQEGSKGSDFDLTKCVYSSD